MTKKFLSKLKMSSNSFTGQKGYLLPAVLMLGLAISTASVTALQTISYNSATLNDQYHGAVAKEAAQAGISAAIACINNNAGTRVWGTGGSTDQQTLTPKGCSTSPTGADDFIDDNETYRSTYRVTPVYDLNDVPSRRTNSIITAKGIVQIKGPGGAIVGTVEHTARTQVATNIPTTISPDKKNVVQISTGNSTACGVTSDASINDYWVYCWGDNSNLQLGNGRYLQSNRSTVPLPVYSSPTGQAQILGACQPFLWNPCHYRDNPPTTPAQAATPMAGKRAVKVSVGNTHTCAIAQDGSDANTRRAYCWGRNDNGQLGTGNTNDSLIPLAVSVASPSALQSGGAAKTVTDITAGNGFTCALTSDGLVSCWGVNGSGQLGNLSTSNSSIPVAVSTRSTPAPASALYNKQVQSLAKIKGDATTMCVITTEERGACWGEGITGQRGDGVTIPASSDRSGSSRINNNNACNQARTNAINQAGGYRSTSSVSTVPVAVQGSLLFKELTITAASWVENISLGARNITHEASYVSAITSPSSANPNRSYYWGGEVAFEQYVSCRQNGSGGGTSDYALATARLTYGFSGTSTPSGPRTQTGQGSPAGSSPLTLASGNSYDGLFCAKASSTGGQVNIYCDAHGSNAREGRLGNGVVCTSACATGPVQVSTAQGADTSSFHGSDLTIGMAQTVSDLDTGVSDFTCALASPSVGLSTVLCWGVNSSGQLGINSTSNRFAPAYVYTADTTGLGRVSGGTSAPPSASGIAAINTSNGSIPNPTAGKSF